MAGTPLLAAREDIVPAVAYHDGVGGGDDPAEIVALRSRTAEGLEGRAEAADHADGRIDEGAVEVEQQAGAGADGHQRL